MNRFLLVAVPLALAGPLAAQQPPRTVSLTLTAAAAPARSLQYRLLPDARELTPGNAATLYQRSLAMFVENEALLKELRKEYWYTWASLPPGEWPADEVAGKIHMARHVLHEIGLAARCKECDWQISQRPEGLGLLLPELQTFRSIGIALAVQARHQVLGGQFADAARTLETGLALARHLGSGPTLIHVLVGAAIAQNMIDQAEAWVQKPGSPSLYWPLAVLPRPLLDVLPAFREDVYAVGHMLPWAKQLHDGVWTDQQVAAAQATLDKVMTDFAVRQPDGDELAGQALLRAAVHREAQKALADQGMPAERLKAMPAFQVIALYSFREAQAASEELLKWVHLPEHFGHPAYLKAVERYNQALLRIDRLYFNGLLKGLSDGGGEGYSAMVRVFDAAGRVDRRLALLRATEAIRLHLAAAEGKLPAKLADISVIPVPGDPVTGKPFEYTVQKDTARLHAPPRAGQKPSAINSLTYELRVK